MVCVCWHSGVRCHGVCVATVELDAMVCVLVQWSKMPWCVCWYSGVRCNGVCVATVE